MIGRLCEEFRYTPEAAYRVWLTAPCGFLEEIIEARQFARAKAVYEDSRGQRDRPRSALIDLVQEIEFDLIAKERDA